MPESLLLYTWSWKVCKAGKKIIDEKNMKSIKFEKPFIEGERFGEIWLVWEKE